MLTLPNIDIWCQKKGIDVVAVGDFTHPQRYWEMKELLVEKASGLYQLKNNSQNTYFIMSTEVAAIYSHLGKVRRLHLCLFLSSLEKVQIFNQALEKRGAKLKSDGRPILGMSAKDILKILKDVDPDGFMVPAHAWTPWFAVFGSKSGYNSLAECFEEMTPEIKAIETGLSSDPLMNWRVSALDHINLISNSDAHSLANLGRKANIFALDELSYAEIKTAINDKSANKLVQTIEFYPEEGMYHYDGHRACNVSFAPAETKKRKGICPICGRQLTLGVAYRVDELADRSEKDIHRLGNFVSIVPLQEILADVYQVGKGAKKIINLYDQLVQRGGNEFNILLNLSKEQIIKISNVQIAEAIIKMRNKEIDIQPGFDGQYGRIKIAINSEKRQQISLI
ncbi:MAG: DNA helicase UvrD [Candidatus Komeilibacteria bacterium CG_4_9_14_3_um_filter_37_5]|nr:MAG: DNA helicase UvrD [Candidatus Komeilibacteria bacterium CG_4_9_14_3_um_filter_37_5]